MLKISYISDWNKEMGTHYTQRVRATGKEMSKIAYFLNKDYEYIQNIKKTKNVYTSNEMHKIVYQKHLAETPQEIMPSGATKFYLNLTQLDTILHNIKDILSENGQTLLPKDFLNIKRLKYRNTILVLGE